MSNKWKEISIEEARCHPLYGVGGWLVVFAILVAFEFVFRVLYYLGGVRDQASSAYWGVLGILFLSILVIYWLLFTKHHFFRHIVSALYVIYLLLLDYNFYYWIVPYAIWIIYLQRSERVRVTYEHRVLQGSFQNDSNLQMQLHVPMARAEHLEARLAAIGEVQTSATMKQVKQPELNTQTNSSKGVTSVGIANITKQTPKITTASQVTPIPPSDMDPPLSEEFWAAAYTEFESPARRPGLWARTYAEANGNEAIAKAAYLTLRVAEIQSTEIKRVEDLKVAEAEIIKQAREKELENIEKQKIYDAAAKGTCPNCKKIILVTANSCEYCTALFEFGVDGTWRPRPLTKYSETQNVLGMTGEEINHSKQLKCICSYCKKALLSPTATSCHKCNITFTASSASFRLIPIDLQMQEEVLSKAIQLRKSFTEFEVDMLGEAIKT
jgi:ribosomal protein L40E